MNKPLFLISALALFLSCNREPQTQQQTEAPKASRLSVLDALFKDIAIKDTFFVYSMWSDEHKINPFQGTPMDSDHVTLLPYEERLSYSHFKDFGACYKFPLDESHLALIARVAGEYECTAIQLFVFDMKKDSVVRTIRLADIFGDAGESMWYSSCIFRDSRHALKLATHWHSEYSHNVDNENDTTVERRNRFYLLDLDKHAGDTLAKDSAYIINQHPQIMKRLAAF